MRTPATATSAGSSRLGGSSTPPADAELQRRAAQVLAARIMPSVERILETQTQVQADATGGQLLPQQSESLATLTGYLRVAPVSAVAPAFDMVYLPVFTILVAHPKAQEKQQRAAPPAGSTTAAAAASASIAAQTSAASPAVASAAQERTWTGALECLEQLLTCCAQAPTAPRLAAAISRRMFGIFQLLLHFLPAPAEAKSSPEDAHTAPTAVPTFGHPEETRLLAMACLQALFRTVEAQLSTSATPAAELQPLLTTIQSNPGFAVSLGYFIHTLTKFAQRDRNRALRRAAIEGVEAVMRVLQLPALNSTSATQPASGSFSPVPGLALLLSYFPGVATALHHILIYDSSVISSEKQLTAGSTSSSFNSVLDQSTVRNEGGTKLRVAAWELFDKLLVAVVRYVAGVEDIVRDALEKEDQRAEAAEEEEDSMEAEDAQTRTADRTLEKLRALVPQSSSSSSSISLPIRSPVVSLSTVHPVLQSVLRPIDRAWWHQTSKELRDMLMRVLQATQLTKKAVMTRAMLTSVAAYLIGSPADSASFPSLTQHHSTIFSSLLPESVTLACLEFVILCGQHDDAGVRQHAEEVVKQLAQRRSAGGQPGSGRALAVTSDSLVPILSSSLSRHLLRLPRTFPTLSEAGQISALRTLQGFVKLLGQQGGGEERLWEWMKGEMERLLKIMYATWTVEGRESKVLERTESYELPQLTDGSSTSSESSTVAASSPAATSLALPSYYTFSFLHCHSSLSHSLSLALLHSFSFYVGEQWGLWVARLHERMREGVEEVERGNYSDTNGLKETIVFLNQSILGIGEAMKVDGSAVNVWDIMPHIELLLHEYLQPSLWHLDSVRGAHLSHSDRQTNSLIVSLLLRGLGDMAVALGREFRPMLMVLLYPLLEKLGSPQAQIHQAALATLHRVAFACGYAEELRAPPKSADDVLQAMLVENMDYLVEQLAVELRTIDLQAPLHLDRSTPSSHPLTLPLVLSALLTKVSLECTQAILPLLDDVLKTILEKLCMLSLVGEEAYLEETQNVDGEGISQQMSRLAYLEILRSVVAAIHMIQQNDSALETAPVVESLFASAPPLPLLSTPNLLKSPSAAELTEEERAIQEADSMLNLEGYEDAPKSNTEPSKSEENKEEQKQPPLSEATATAAPYYAPSSIRARLQLILDQRAAQAARERREEEWLRGSRKGAIVEEGTEEDAADDEERKGASSSSSASQTNADGKTPGEVWFEEREAYRAAEAEKKYNLVHGAPLDDAHEKELEEEAQAHKDAPEVPLTKEQATTLQIFQQCRHFLVPGSGTAALAQQYTTLCIAAESIPVLERVPKHFFPEIAKFWPALLQGLRLIENATRASTTAGVRKTIAGGTLKGGAFSNSIVSSEPGLSTLLSVRAEAEASSAASDQQLTQLIQSLDVKPQNILTNTTASTTFTHSTASPLFLQSLHILSLLSRSASKFLAGRFSQELWPVLQGILQLERKWMRETESDRMRTGEPARGAGGKTTTESVADAALKLLPAYKIQLALLETLSQLARFPDLSTQHLLSMASHTVPYLSSSQPLEFQSLALRTLGSLAQLDVDAVWFVVWKVAPWIGNEPARPSPSSSSASLPPLTCFVHPCFQQVYPNFDANFLAHQRRLPFGVEKRKEEATTGGLDENVKKLLEMMEAARTQAPPKLTL